MIMITSITPADRKGQAIGPTINNILAPATYGWSKEDISAADAGRSVALHMIKMQQGKARVLNLGWKNRSYAEIAAVFQAFDHEYILMTYIDALTGTYATKHFYMSAMSSNSYTSTGGGIWELASVKCIQAIVDLVTPT